MRRQEAEQGVLHDLRERGMDPVLPAGHGGGVEAGRHGLDERLDEGGRLRSDHVRAQNLAGDAVGDDLGDARGVFEGPAVGGRAVGLDSDGDVPASGARLVLAVLTLLLGGGLREFLIITVIGALSWVVILAADPVRVTLDVDRDLSEFTREVSDAVTRALWRPPSL